MGHPANTGEQDILRAARAIRDRCVCGKTHPDGDGITPAVVGRMRAYLAGNPGHQFAVDEEAGIVAVVVAPAPAPGAPGPPEIIAWSNDLLELLAQIDAPPAENLS